MNVNGFLEERYFTLRYSQWLNVMYCIWKLCEQK